MAHPYHHALSSVKKWGGTVDCYMTDLGFEALDAGDITKARLLEPFGMVWINQALMRGKGRNWAFAAVSA